MASNGFLKRMPSGIPGMVNRAWTAVIEAAALSLTDAVPTAYGVAVTADAAGNVRAMTSGDTATLGFLVRSFPTQSSQDPLGTSTPPTSGIIDILKLGYMTVLLGGTQAAVKNGPVYIWKAASSGSHVQGQVEAADPTSNGFVLPGGYFLGPADASGNVEIAFQLM